METPASLAICAIVTRLSPMRFAATFASPSIYTVIMAPVAVRTATAHRDQRERGGSEVVHRRMGGVADGEACQLENDAPLFSWLIVASAPARVNCNGSAHPHLAPASEECGRGMRARRPTRAAASAGQGLSC